MSDDAAKCAKCGGLVGSRDLFCGSCGAARPSTVGRATFVAAHWATNVVVSTLLGAAVVVGAVAIAAMAEGRDTAPTATPEDGVYDDWGDEGEEGWGDEDYQHGGGDEEPARPAAASGPCAPDFVQYCSARGYTSCWEFPNYGVAAQAGCHGGAEIGDHVGLNFRSCCAPSEAGVRLPIGEASASRYYAPPRGHAFPPAQAFDGDAQTAWAVQDAAPGAEWIQGCLPEYPYALSRVVITTGYDKSSERWGDLFIANAHLAAGDIFVDGALAGHFEAGNDQRHATVDLGADSSGRCVRLVPTRIWPGTRWQDLSVSEIEVWGDPSPLVE